MLEPAFVKKEGKMEKMIKASIYLEILENANMGMLVINQSGKILDCNSYYCKLVGYEKSELRLMVMKDLRIDSPDKVIEEIKEARKTKYSIRESIHRHKEGRLVNVRTTASYLSGNRVLSYFVQDITEEKKGLKFREEYMSLVVHDLKSPLTSMKLSAGVIRSLIGNDQPRIAKALEVIERSGQQALEMLENILKVSRFEIVGFDFSRYPLDLHDLVHDIVAHTIPVSEQKRLSVSSIRVSLPIMGNEEYLRRAVTNIMQNALRYSPRHEKVELKLYRIKNSAVLSVVDHGPGIGQEEIPHLFEQYYRGVTIERRSGTGLGLYISKLIVDSLGGEIAVESKIGMGSSFIIKLPLA